MDRTGKSLGREASSGQSGPRFLYESVLDQLRKRVTDGRTPDGEKLPTLKTLAEELDVSTMTVRKAIRTLEDEGHVRHISGVGTFVRQDPRLPPVTQRFIAFVGACIGSTFQMGIAHGVQRAGQRHRWAVQLLDAHLDSEIEGDNIENLPASGVKGAIVLPPLADPRTVRILFEVQAKRFPIVLVDQEISGLKADLVASDHEAGGYQAANHLLSRGHRQIVMLTHPTSSSSVAARVAGYQRALTGAGVPPKPEWLAWIDPATHAAGYREGRRWLGGYQAILPVLRQIQPPVAVIGIDAYVGWGVYEACRELNLRIPEDVSVIAFDDSEVTHALRPSMTIISQRMDEIGRTAIRLLERRIEAMQTTESVPTEFRHVFVDVDLVERESVARIAQ